MQSLGVKRNKASEVAKTISGICWALGSLLTSWRNVPVSSKRAAAVKFEVTQFEGISKPVGRPGLLRNHHFVCDPGLTKTHNRDLRLRCMCVQARKWSSLTPANAARPRFRSKRVLSDRTRHVMGGAPAVSQVPPPPPIRSSLAKWPLPPTGKKASKQRRWSTNRSSAMTSEQWTCCPLNSPQSPSSVGAPWLRYRANRGQPPSRGIRGMCFAGNPGRISRWPPPEVWEVGFWGRLVSITWTGIWLLLDHI
jgi:hypothetical protein